MIQLVRGDEHFSKHTCLQRFSSCNLQLRQNIRITYWALKKKNTDAQRLLWSFWFKSESVFLKLAHRKKEKGYSQKVLGKKVIYGHETSIQKTIIIFYRLLECCETIGSVLNYDFQWETFFNIERGESGRKKRE